MPPGWATPGHGLPCAAGRHQGSEWVCFVDSMWQRVCQVWQGLHCCRIPAVDGSYRRGELGGEIGTWCWGLAAGGSREEAPLLLSLAYFQQQQAGETVNVSGPPCTTEHHVGGTMGA